MLCYVTVSNSGVLARLPISFNTSFAAHIPLILTGFSLSYPFLLLGGKGTYAHIIIALHACIKLFVDHKTRSLIYDCSSYCIALQLSSCSNLCKMSISCYRYTYLLHSFPLPLPFALHATAKVTPKEV